MSNARLRMVQYYLDYARQHKHDWQALDGAQFEQIQRGWTFINGRRWASRSVLSSPYRPVPPRGLCCEELENHDQREVQH